MSKSGYEWKIVAVLAIIWGIIGLERMSMVYLFPIIMPAFNMTATQAGALVSTFAICWAVSMSVSGNLSDRIGRKKVILPATIFFAAVSVFTGMVGKVGQLFAAWGIMGAATSASFPASVATIAEESTPERRGLNMGLQQAFFPLIGVGLGAIIVTTLGQAVGWRMTLMILGGISLICALLVAFVMKEPPSIRKMLEDKKSGIAAESKAKTPMSVVFKYRNVVVSIIVSCLYMNWMFVLTTFCIMYLTKIRGFEVATAGLILSALGFSGFVGMIAVPAISDNIGRRPTMIISSILAGLGTFYFTLGGFGPTGLFIVLFVTGMFGYGAYPVFLSIFPSESVPQDVLGAAVSTPPSIGELFGSAAMPTIAGFIADAYGLQYPMYLAAITPLIAAFVSFFYIETAPKILARKKLAA